MIATVFVAAAAVLWWALILVPWRPWRTDCVLDVQGATDHETLASVTALIPARNEAPVLGACLAALRVQAPGMHIVVVDDESSDGTADIAQAAGARVIAGRPVPRGWSGKVWALEQGRAEVGTEYVLLVDADVALAPGVLTTLLAKARMHALALVSIYPVPLFAGFWDRLLMPAFVYFFALLYPFRLSNSPRSRVAAASGGCVLLERAALEKIGGFGAIRGALIDDCSLAGAVKAAGYRTWIGLTHSVQGLRAYGSFAAIRAMVERTAYTQLHYSIVWLIACTLLMLLAFCVPVVAVFHPLREVEVLAAAALTAMAASYLPTLRFYARSRLWVVLLPAIGALYLAMTWGSALRFYRSERAKWKGRVYA
jgi:hopene-associated glycosyltransferase HpnB